MTLTVDFPPSLWLTANRPISNRGQKARIVREIHELVQGQAMVQWRGQTLNTDVLRIASWTVHYPRGIRTDKGEASNAAPLTKAYLDALVPRYLPDDGPRFIAEERFRRGANLDVPHVHRVVLELVEVEG